MAKNYLVKEEERVDDLIQSLSLGIYIFNSEGKILDANSVFLNFFRASSVSELDKRNIAELLHLRRVVESLDLSKNERVIQEFELQMEGSEGISNVLIAVRPFRDISMGKILYQGIFLEINDRKILQPPPPPETLRDPLTGCYSRLYLPEFEDKMEQRSWGSLVVYLDHFKQFRDRHGLALALEATLKMSRFLMRHIRAEDGIVKLDNDHFIVLLEGADPAGTLKVAKRMKTSALGQAPLRFSLGASARSGAETLQQTIHRADQDLTPVRVLERTPKSGRKKAD